MKIFISDSAFSDLEEIKKYYTNEGAPHVGDEFVISIITHLESLKENPNIGRKVPEFNEESIRELIHSPFRIVYLKEVNYVNVIRVWRSERLLNIDDTPANKKI